VTVTPLEIAIGVSADLAFGDPKWMPHPVRWFGRVAAALEGAWRSTGLPLRTAGVLFWISAVGLATSVVTGTLLLVPRPWGHALWVYLLLAARDLDVHAAEVVQQLRRGDLQAARSAVGEIVGRDTAELDEPEILRATFETVAENLNDGVIAPLFYLALAGPAGMALYKAANTLDSMVGYRNERYRDFGWASARIDDVLNYIPARLSAVLVWVTASLPPFRFRRSVAITLRDAHRQPSPNSGYPEAAVAGALGVRFGGLNLYAGVPSHKEFLGNPDRPLTPDMYSRLRMLLYVPTLLATVLACGWALWR
jgi:adenosylcobinamide-phosphate synthase